MALFHQLWDFPDDKTLKEGRKTSRKRQKLHAANPRDRASSTPPPLSIRKIQMTHAERTQAYSAALKHFYSANSGDAEIGSFYALSLVSLATKTATPLQTAKSLSILEPLLQQHPDHPGVAHYMIHATIAPEFAAQGLEAARRYAAIATGLLPRPAHAFPHLRAPWPVAGFHHFEYRRDRFRRACRGNAPSGIPLPDPCHRFPEATPTFRAARKPKRANSSNIPPRPLGRVRKIKRSSRLSCRAGLRSSCTVGKKQPPLPLPAIRKELE